MKLLLILLLFGSSLIASDEYPYFSDPAKQLEFEEGRIYITSGYNSITITKNNESTCWYC